MTTEQLLAARPAGLPSNVRNLLGHVFAHLTVVSFAGRISGRCHWNCLCDCPLENVIRVSHYALTYEIIKSCGKSPKCNLRPWERTDRGPGNQFVNLVGRKFHDLTVLKHHGRLHNKQYWQCLCSCGCVISAAGNSLKNGTTKNCGCSRRRGMSYSIFEQQERQHDLCALWMAILREYKGSVCDEWMRSFEDFRRDVGKKPSVNHRLMRIEVPGLWCRGNTLWGTRDMEMDPLRLSGPDEPV